MTQDAKGKGTSGAKTEVKGVTIMFGANKTDDASLVGRTVSAAKTRYKDTFGITRFTYAVLNGHIVFFGGTKILRTGDRLEFVKVAGRKG